MDILNLIISLVSGIAGGNAAGAAMKNNNLGPLWNSIAGLFGGGIGGQILNALGVFATAAAPGVTPGAEGLDIGALVANIAGSGVGGAVLTAIVTWLKHSIQKP